jgi:hypothetical protein
LTNAGEANIVVAFIRAVAAGVEFQFIHCMIFRIEISKFVFEKKNADLIS